MLNGTFSAESLSPSAWSLSWPGQRRGCAWWRALRVDRDASEDNDDPQSFRSGIVARWCGAGHFVNDDDDLRGQQLQHHDDYHDDNVEFRVGLWIGLGVRLRGYRSGTWHDSNHDHYDDRVEGQFLFNASCGPAVQES
jgi:hypothetical protein